MIPCIAATLQPAMTTFAASPNHALTASAARTAYLSMLTWCFTLFSSVRFASYLPTMWAIQTSGNTT